MHRFLLRCVCPGGRRCFPYIYVPDAMSAMAVINATGCDFAIYSLCGGTTSSILIIRGVFSARLSFSGDYGGDIDLSIVDMFLFCQLFVYNCNCHDKSIDAPYPMSFTITNDGISIDGIDIKPYCDFKIVGAGVFIPSCTKYIDNEQFVALSAATNGDSVLY